MTNGHFATALAALLKSSEMTPKQLADSVGRSQQAVSQWLHKGDIPALEIIFTIEQLLGHRRGLLAEYAEPSLRNLTAPPAPEELFREGLLRMSLTDIQRKSLLELLGMYQEHNRSTGTKPPPALPEL